MYINVGGYSNVKDVEGDTILHWIINMHETKFVIELLKGVEDIDVNLRNDKGISPLLLAASKWL